MQNTSTTRERSPLPHADMFFPYAPGYLCDVSRVGESSGEYMCECQERRIHEHVASVIDDDDEDAEPFDSVVCPVYLVGCLVGKHGQTMKYLQEQTNTRITIGDADIDGMRRVFIEGARSSAIDKAKQMIYGILGIGCSEMYYTNRNAYQVRPSFGLSIALVGLPLVWDDACVKLSAWCDWESDWSSRTDAKDDSVDLVCEALYLSRQRTVHNQRLRNQLGRGPGNVGDSRNRRRVQSNRRPRQILRSRYPFTVKPQLCGYVALKK